MKQHPLRIIAAVLGALVMLAFYATATRALPPYNVYLPLAGRDTNFGPTVTPGTPRPFPDTSGGIFVFNDQLATWDMTEAQFQFAATHYVGTQKVTRADARHLRQYNPNLIVLHYRLGQALGYRLPDSSCNPTGTLLEIIDGDGAPILIVSPKI